MAVQPRQAIHAECGGAGDCVCSGAHVLADQHTMGWWVGRICVCAVVFGGRAVWCAWAKYTVLLVGGLLLCGMVVLLFVFFILDVNSPSCVLLHSFLSFLLHHIRPLCLTHSAIILETNPPEARGMALALQTVLDDLGRGLGPFVIGLLVQVTSRQVAFNIAVLGWIPCGALIFGTRIFWGGCMHLYAPKRCCSSLHAITAARWYIVKEVDAMQQHLLHVAARCGAAVVEPPGSDAWGGDDEHHEVLPTSNAAPGMRAGAGLRTVEMQSVVEEDSKRGALLPPSYTPSDAA